VSVRALSSEDRTQHNAASNASRTGCPAACRSDRAARARHASISRSDESANNPAGGRNARTAVNLSISRSSVSKPTMPGSAFKSATTPGGALTGE
jgi:hypothetical protein